MLNVFVSQVGISTWMSTAFWVIVTSATNCGMLLSLLWRHWETTLYRQRKPRWEQWKRWGENKQNRSVFIYIHPVEYIFWPSKWLVKLSSCHHCFLSGDLVFPHAALLCIHKYVHIHRRELLGTGAVLTKSECFLFIFYSILSVVWRGECVRQVDSF